MSNFIYSHKTTERWKTFRACLVEEFLSNSIDHILYSERIEQMQKKPELPAITQIPVGETPDEREQRIAQQKLLEEDWKQAYSEHRKRIGERLLSRECQLGMGILLQHVDLDFKRDLQELLERPENSYDHWNLLWERLETEWRPSTHFTLDGNKMHDQGWLATVLVVQVQRNRIGSGADRDEGRRRKQDPWFVDTTRGNHRYTGGAS